MSERRPETDREILSRSQAVGVSVGIGPITDLGRTRKYRINLTAHMAECDVNYFKLQKLFPDMRSCDEKNFQVSFSDNCFVMSMAVLERGPYTTSIVLNQEVNDNKWHLVPSIQVRVYHDAKSAEVVKVSNQNYFHGDYEYPNRKMRQPDEKEQINRFLGELLSLCLENGISSESSARG